MNINFLESALYVTETLRYHDLSNTNKNTSLLYASLIDNKILTDLINNSVINVNLSEELSYFVMSRLYNLYDYITNTIVDVFVKNNIMSNFDIDKNSNFKFSNIIYNNNNIVTMRDYQNLECNIDQMINIIKSAYNNDTRYDLINVLKVLYKSFRYTTTLWFTDKTKLYKLNSMNINQDVSSKQLIALIAYLFTKVAFILYTHEISWSIKDRHDFDDVECNFNINETLDLGYMSLINIMCCFNNLSFINNIIESKNGHISNDVRKFLAEIIKLSIYKKAKCSINADN